MTVKNFWTILLKVLGIWLAIGALSTISQFVTAFSFIGTNANWWNSLYIVFLLLVTLGVYVLVLWLFVFKTSWLINILKLEKGFAEDKIEFDIQSSVVLKIATIVVGAFVFIDSLPHFCSQTFMFFQQKNVLVDNTAAGWVILYLVKTVIGYLLMTNSKSVVEFIEKHEKKAN